MDIAVIHKRSDLLGQIKINSLIDLITIGIQ